MLFTLKQSKDFIEQLYGKKQIQLAVEAVLKALTLQLHIPVSIANSGSKRVFENLFNSKEFQKNYTITTSSIQVSLGSVTLDSKQNTAPTQTYLYLKSGNIPHKFTTTAYQKVLNQKLNCKFIASNPIEALQNMEYIIDNLSNMKVFRFKSLGIQFQACYGLFTDDFDGNANKLFDYSNTPNTTEFEFTIELELTYISYQTASIIKYIYDRTDDPDRPTPPDEKDPPIDVDTGGETKPITPNDGDIIVGYIGTVATVSPYDLENDEFFIDGGTWYHSDGITEKDLKMHVRVKDIDDANNREVQKKPKPKD